MQSKRKGWGILLRVCVEKNTQKRIHIWMRRKEYTEKKKKKHEIVQFHLFD